MPRAAIATPYLDTLVLHYGWNSGGDAGEDVPVEEADGDCGDSVGSSDGR